jgi:hypothetical protein
MRPTNVLRSTFFPGQLSFTFAPERSMNTLKTVGSASGATGTSTTSSVGGSSR